MKIAILAWTKAVSECFETKISLPEEGLGAGFKLEFDGGTEVYFYVRLIQN